MAVPQQKFPEAYEGGKKSFFRTRYDSARDLYSYWYIQGISVFAFQLVAAVAAPSCSFLSCSFKTQTIGSHVRVALAGWCDTVRAWYEYDRISVFEHNALLCLVSCQAGTECIGSSTTLQNGVLVAVFGTTRSGRHAHAPGSSSVSSCCNGSLSFILMSGNLGALSFIFTHPPEDKK